MGKSMREELPLANVNVSISSTELKVEVCALPTDVAYNRYVMLPVRMPGSFWICGRLIYRFQYRHVEHSRARPTACRGLQ